MIYILIYFISMVVMLAVFLLNKSQLKIWQKVLMVLFAPVMVVVFIVGAIVICIDHIVKHGFHNILPRRKGKVYPLDKDDLRVWSKDTILCGDNKMTITEYNKENGKILTLDDVYGSGYTDSLSPEDIYGCKTFIPHRYGLEPNMPDYIYKDIAIAFAKAFTLGDASFIRSLLSEKTYLTLYKKKKFSGVQQIVDYFTTWFNDAKRDNLEVRVTARWQPNQCRPAVYIKPKDYREMVLLFVVKNGTLSDIVFAPSLLQDYGCMFHDLNQPPYSIDFMSRAIGEDEETREYYLPCPICGFDSALLDWYKFHLPMGIHCYSGLVSVCPDCKKVVEFMPDMRIRYEEPQHLSFEEGPQTITTEFTPRLLGIYTLETDDEQMDFYSETELQDVCHRNLKSYHENGDLEKGNDAAVIYTNGSLDDYAIDLFTELSEKGCQNSMLNLFSIYWSIRGDYKKAVEWLQYITGVDNPSIKCLWNLAVLNYYGPNLPNNPLPKNQIEAKKILGRIKDIPMEGFSDDIKRVIADAKKFYPLVDQLNDFSLSGISIHDIITNSIVKTTGLKDKGELFNRAKAISLKPGFKLGLHIANANTEDIGDESFFYLYDDNGIEHKIYTTRIDLSCIDTSKIMVQPTAMGAWQLYLLITSTTIMPVFWHGGYSVRKFIFSVDDLKTIESIKHLDFSTLNHDDILLPKSIVADDGKSADVYCTFWNDWKGLVREHVHIKFNPDSTASYGKPDEFVYYHYDCGICF